MQHGRSQGLWPPLARAARRIPIPLAVSLAIVVAYTMVRSTARAADDIPVMRVEEDWEVVLNEPGSDVDAPQFHTIISPYANLDSYHLQVCWNYREQYDFAAGGMQLLAWKGEASAGYKSYREDKLSTVAETVSWTQSVTTTGCSLTFEVKNGSSITWGNFGGALLRLTGNVYVPNLNNYSPTTSAAESWISYGANRVDLLRIKEVRHYDAEGRLISRDQTPRIVYQLQ